MDSDYSNIAGVQRQDLPKIALLAWRGHIYVRGNGMAREKAAKVSRQLHVGLGDVSPEGTTETVLPMLARLCSFAGAENPAAAWTALTLAS